VLILVLVIYVSDDHDDALNPFYMNGTWKNCVTSLYFRVKKCNRVPVCEEVGLDPQLQIVVCSRAVTLAIVA